MRMAMLGCETRDVGFSARRLQAGVNVDSCRQWHLYVDHLLNIRLFLRAFIGG